MGRGTTVLGMRAVPWSPDGSDNAFDVQVGMERPAEMVLRLPGEVLMEIKVARTYLRRADFERWGLSEGWVPVPENGPEATASSQRSTSEERLKALLRGRLVWVRTSGCNR